jgi:hypothetical protein
MVPYKDVAIGDFLKTNCIARKDHLAKCTFYYFFKK